MPETGRQGRRLAEISPEPNAVNSFIFSGQVPDHAPRPVRAAVIHEENLQL